MTRALLLSAGALALLAATTACGAEDEPAPLEVTWAGSESVPACEYDATNKTVEARLTMSGGSVGDKVYVTVGAYADENTSDQVGTFTRGIEIETTDRTEFTIEIPVDRRPHRGEDGGTACRLSVTETPPQA